MRVDKLVEALRVLPPYAEILIETGEDEMNGQMVKRFEPVMAVVSMYDEMPVPYCENRHRLTAQPAVANKPDKKLIPEGK